MKESTTADTTVSASCAQKLTQPMRLHPTTSVRAAVLRMSESRKPLLQ